ncbi:hypothetical protein [Uliginosibacterium sp. 31-12]|uniref:hypothetical protein n=1 Tax=Uliginosibacterium sp. 31-12 TaxID=3062781 RepID=UPI0026E33F69|nr:hypothetical protein [Uliginosibacterium sp. 31-12]MDO6387045.1 hypothetical protein [Uliginosibacterium sp. 31-12]
MPVLITVAALLLLWGFIVWDRRKPSQKMSRHEIEKGWSAKPLLKWPLLLALSLVFLMLGTIEWLDPSLPPFTGKLSVIVSIAHTSFGAHGPAYVYFCVGVMLLVLAFVLWQRKERQEP